MKVLGLAGAGLGGVVGAAPVFHDLDELMSSSEANPGRPWWVKQVDEPTIEIDWDMMERHAGFRQAQRAEINRIYYGDRVDKASAIGNAANKARYDANELGYRHKDRALYSGDTALNICREAGDFGWAGTNGKNVIPSQTPEQMGIPKWTGSPEEASQMMRSAIRLYGGSLVGFLDVTDHERKHVFLSHGEKDPKTARPIVYEDVDRAYETPNPNGKLVFPTKQMWEISVSTQGSNELFRRAPALSLLANRNTFPTVGVLNACTFNFLRALGYQQVAIIGNDGLYLDSGGPPAIMSGVGEASRQKLYTLTPEYGAPGRLYSIGTDLPLAPTKPIDAGMYRFCHSCHKCANFCPPGAISQEKDSSWEMPLVNGQPNIFSVKGTKAFYTDFPICRTYTNENGACMLCWGECTFTVNRGAMVHGIIKSTISTTGLFNGFFYKMAETFDYGCKEPDSWWELNLPVFGQDYNVVSSSGAYKK